MAISTTMASPSSRLILQSLHHGLAELTDYWDRQRNSHPTYKVLLAHLWDRLASICSTSLLDHAADLKTLNYVLSCQFSLLMTLFNPQVMKSKKSGKVHFSDNQEKEEPKEVISSVVQGRSPELLQEVNELLRKSVRAWYSTGIESENGAVTDQVVEGLEKVAFKLGGRELVNALGLDQDDLLVKLTSLLEDPQRRKPALFRLVFALMPALEPNSLLHPLLSDPSDMGSALSEAITFASKSPGAKDWLRSEAVENSLCNLAEDPHHNMSLLQVVLSSNCVLTGPSVTRILNRLNVAHHSDWSPICQLLSNLYSGEGDWRQEPNTHQASFSILTTLLQTALVESTLDLLEGPPSWVHLQRSIVKDAPLVLFQNHIENIARTIENILSNEWNGNSKILVQLANILTELLQLGIEVGLEVQDLIDILIKNIYTEIQVKKGKAFEDYVVTGLQTYSLLPWSPPQPVTPFAQIDVVCYSQSTYLATQILKPFPSVLSSEVLLRLTHSTSIIRSWTQCFSCSNEPAMKIQLYPDLLQHQLGELVRDFPQPDQLLATASQKAVTGQPLWTLIHHKILGLLNQQLIPPTIPPLPDILTSEYVRLVSSSLARSSEVNEGAVTALLHSITSEEIKRASALFEKNLNNADTSDLEFSTEVAYFLVQVFKKCPHLLTPPSWNFVLVSTASWISSLHKTTNPTNFPYFVRLEVTVVELLFITLSEYLNSNTLPQTHSQYKDEWNNVFSQEIHSFIRDIWKNLAEQRVDNAPEGLNQLQLDSLSKAVTYIVKINKFLPPSPSESVVKTWAKVASTCIFSSHSPVFITSFHIYQYLAPLFVTVDSATEQEDQNKLFCNIHFKELLENTETVIHTLIHEFKVGVSCLIQPCTDSYTYSRAYLMLWLSFFQMFQLGDSRLRHMYALWLKDTNFIPVLMENLLRLMPHGALNPGAVVNPTKIQELFSSHPPFSYDNWSSERLGELSCWVYSSALKSVPTLVRQWYSESDPRTSTLVDKLTSTFVSPILIQEDMSRVSTEEKDDKLKVVVQPISREVVAVYTVEESRSELVIQLAANHPLTPPKVDIAKTVVSTNQTRQWLMKLTIFLAHQNGSIWDCLILWKTNLDKKFEGLEECYICYAVIHHSTQQVPKLSCQTCKKKFHTACLFKWFTSSNKSTCPICRNLF